MHEIYRMEELEMKKIIEQRKREKEEDKLARQRVKELIESDRLARKGMSADSNQIKPNAAPAATPTPVPIVTPKEYTQTKIQVSYYCV